MNQLSKISSLFGVRFNFLSFFKSTKIKNSQINCLFYLVIFKIDDKSVSSSY